MSDLIIATTTAVTLAAIADAICAVWEADADTPAVYGEHTRVNNADFNHSVMGYTPDGQLVGIGMLCRRGARGFVLDFGITPAFRQRGLGHQLFAGLLSQMRAAGLAEVSLLVEARNEPAIRIYERAGFTRQRDLVTLRGQAVAYAPAAAQPVRDNLAEAIMAWYGGGKSAPPQWERALPSLLAMANTRGFETARAFILTRPSLWFSHVDIVHVGLDPEAQAEDLNALLHAATVAYGAGTRFALVEEPCDSRACQLFASLGCNVIERQYEMWRAL